MKRLFVLVAGVGAALALAAAASTAITTIGTTGSWDGAQHGCDWGTNGSTPTYGQTVAGNGESLSSFTFYVNGAGGAAFRPAVYTWTGNAVGTLLWMGPDMNVPAAADSSFAPVTVSVPAGVTLQSGQEYVLLFTTLFSSGPGGSACWGTTTNPYPGGDAVYTNSTTSLTDPWDGNPWGSNDFAFTAQFGGNCWNAEGDGGCKQLPREGVCDAQGRFLDVGVAERANAVATSPLYGATPAAYVQGYGLMCSLTDLATYGGDPSAYKDAGYRVDNTGTRAPAELTDADFGAFYEFFAKA